MCEWSIVLVFVANMYRIWHGFAGLAHGMNNALASYFGHEET